MQFLIQSWWQNDRIRAAPSEGRFLRIESGDVMLIGETQAVVLQRSVISRPNGSMLCLTCETNAGPAELQIEITSEDTTSSMIWKHEDVCSQISTEDVEVWPRHVG